MIKKVLIALLITQASLLAHIGIGTISGFTAGFTHPMSGADHILAMIAVGLWAAQIAGRSLYALPVSFVGMMIVGAMIGIQGIQIPFVEEGILGSVLVLGAMITFGVKMPVIFSSTIVGIFAICHGHAHGVEIPLNVGGIEYALGFVMATVLLHIFGITIGMTMQRYAQSKVFRIAGATIAATGIALVIS
ncbi:MAG: HupE/UreJ family protein [Sulfuricurvum sp.]|nr:HupE/UreJ family protein [Sulfuricurvum sp.]